MGAYLFALYYRDHFHSCGCSGPGYIPNTKIELEHYFTRIRDTYLKHHHFWARRTSDPEMQHEVAKDQYWNRDFISQTPKNFRQGTKAKPKYDAKHIQVYWNEKVREVEKKLDIIAQSK